MSQGNRLVIQTYTPIEVLQQGVQVIEDIFGGVNTSQGGAAFLVLQVLHERMVKVHSPGDSKNQVELRELRIKAGIKAQDAAGTIGISKQSLCYIEKGKHKAKPDIEQKLRELYSKSKVLIPV